MNREKVRHEAIERFTAEWHNDNSAIVEAFEDGAEYMQETMIAQIRNLFRDLEITVNVETRFGVHTATTKLGEGHIGQICDILSR